MAQPKPQPAFRPDPVVVDPHHYQIESEDERVRILRVRYGPREKSTMHGHPACVAVFLTAARVRFTYPDGRTEEMSVSPGQAQVMTQTDHLPENIGDSPFELVLIELKS